VITIALPLPPREQLERRYTEVADSYDKLLFELQRRIRTALGARELNATIKYRVKSFKSYYEKLRRIVRETDQQSGTVVVTDIIALRIVCPFLEEVAAAEQVLREHYEINELDRKGAEFSVREFGYESIHCLLRIPQDLCESFHIGGPFDCEVQLRTILQDAWAEVEHEIVYKSEFTPLDESVQRKLAALNANLSLSDITFQEIRNYQRMLTAELSQRRAAFWRLLSKTVGTSESAVNGDIEILDSQLQFEPADLGVSASLVNETANVVHSGATVGNLDSELLAALQAHNAGDHSRAKEIYTRILDSSPQPFVQAVVLMHRGMAEFADGSYRAALDDFSAALEHDDANCRAHFYHGTVCRVLGDYDRAEIDFGNCLAIDPYRIDCLYQRSALRLQLGDLAGASADCEAALAVEPDSDMLKRMAAAIHERRAYGGSH
jgi:putative GTP pyrophosphokinase